MPEESIELLLASKFDSAQLDHAISRYEALEAAHTRLSGLLEKTPLTFAVHGLNEATRRVGEFNRVVRESMSMRTTGDRVADAFTQKGMPEVAERIRQNTVSVEGALKEQKDKLGRRHEDLLAQERKFARQERDFQAQAHESRTHYAYAKAKGVEPTPENFEQFTADTRRMRDEHAARVEALRTARQQFEAEQAKFNALTRAARFRRPPPSETAGDPLGAQTAATAQKLETAHAETRGPAVKVRETIVPPDPREMQAHAERVADLLEKAGDREAALRVRAGTSNLQQELQRKAGMLQAQHDNLQQATQALGKLDALLGQADPGKGLAAQRQSLAAELEKAKAAHALAKEQADALTKLAAPAGPTVVQGAPEKLSRLDELGRKRKADKLSALEAEGERADEIRAASTARLKNANDIRKANAEIKRLNAAMEAAQETLVAMPNPPKAMKAMKAQMAEREAIRQNISGLKQQVAAQEAAIAAARQASPAAEAARPAAKPKELSLTERAATAMDILDDPHTAERIRKGDLSVQKALADKTNGLNDRGAEMSAAAKRLADFEKSIGAAPSEGAAPKTGRPPAQATQEAEALRLAQAKHAEMKAQVATAAQEFERTKAQVAELTKAAADQPRPRPAPVDPAAMRAAQPVRELADAEEHLRKMMEAKTREALAQPGALKQVGAASKQTAADLAGLKKEEQSVTDELNRERAPRQPGGGLIQTKAKDGTATSEIRQIGTGVTEEKRFVKKGEETIEESIVTNKLLAASWEKAQASARNYGAQMRAVGITDQDKLRITRQHIAALDDEATALASPAQGYEGARELTQMRNLLAQRKRDEAQILRNIDATERLTETAQESLQRQVTTAEHLSAVKQRTLGTREVLADAGKPVAEQVAEHRKLADVLNQQAATMQAEGATEAAIDGVRVRAREASIAAHKLETGEVQRRRLEQEKLDQMALTEGNNLTERLAKEQRLNEVAAARGRAAQSLVGLGRNDPARAQAQEANALALAKEAEASRQLGMSQAHVLDIEKDGLLAANDALGVRMRIAASRASEVQQEAKARALSATIPASAVEVVGRRRTTQQSTGASSIRQEFVQDLGNGFQRTFTQLRRFGAAGNELPAIIRHVDTEMQSLNRTSDWSHRSFLKNTFVVAAWAASVGALYGSLNLLKSGVGGAAALEHQTAVLQTVFRGTKEEGYLLRDEVLKLGIAYGRSSGEAVDAAVRFSRLGLTRVQVQLAVAASLRAANVAEITAAEAAENLASIMAAFGLRATDLSGVLNQLNAVSNTYNVTNKDLLNGIARVGALAHQARLPLADLIGLIATGVGTTGRPGAEFGNAIKALIVSISTPSIQGKLRETFDFDVLTPTGEIKAMNQVLGELYVKYVDVTNAEKQHLTQMLGQKQQASRLAAVLDNYVAGQGLAIRALRDTNSAELENVNIRATMISQLESLKAAFDRASVTLVASSDSSFLTTAVQTASKDLTILLNLISRFPNVTLLMVAGLAMVVVQMLRLAMAADAAGTKGSFLANTGKHLKMVWSEMGLALRSMVTGLQTSNAWIGSLSATCDKALVRMKAMGPAGSIASGGLRAMGTAALFTVAALASVTKLLAGLLVAQLAFTVVGKLFGEDTTDTERQTAALAGYNDEIERAAKASEAFQKSADLYQTVAKTLPHRSPERQKEDIAIVAQAAEPVDLKKRADLQAELTSLAQRRPYSEFEARMNEMTADARRRAAENAQQELTITRQLLDVQNRLARQIQAAIELKNASHTDASREREELANVNRAVSELMDKRGKLRGLAEEETDAANAGAYRHEKLVEERLRLMTESLERTAKEVPTLGPRDEAEGELEMLRAKAAMEEAGIERIKREAAARKTLAAEAVKAAEASLAAGHERGPDHSLRALQDRLAMAKSRAEALANYERQAWNDRRARTGETEEDAMSGKSLGTWGTTTYLLGEARDRLLSRLGGAAATEGEARMKGLKESAQSLGMDVNWKGHATPESLEEKRKSIAAEMLAAQAEMDHFTSTKRGYLDLLATREKLLHSAQAAGTADNEAAEHEKVKLTENLNILRQQIRAYEQLNPERLRQVVIIETEEKVKRDSLIERTPFATGLTETEQTLRQVRQVSTVIIPAHERSLNEAEQAGDQLAILKEQTTLRENLAFLQNSEYALELRRAELARDLTNELMKQTVEESKKLLLAGRQAQLQAAYAKKFFGNRQATLHEIQFMSPASIEATRAIGALPDVLTPAGDIRRQQERLERGLPLLQRDNAEAKQRTEGRLNTRATSEQFIAALSQGQLANKVFDVNVVGAAGAALPVAKVLSLPLASVLPLPLAQAAPRPPAAVSIGKYGNEGNAARRETTFGADFSLPSGLPTLSTRGGLLAVSPPSPMEKWKTEDVRLAAKQNEAETRLSRARKDAEDQSLFGFIFQSKGPARNKAYQDLVAANQERTKHFQQFREAQEFTPTTIIKPEPAKTTPATIKPDGSALERVLSKKVTDAQAEMEAPTASLQPAELIGYEAAVAEVRKLSAELYGREPQKSPATPDVYAYGERGQKYNIEGKYNLRTNQLKLSRAVMEDFAKGDPEAQNTVVHELSHWMQDMMSGDVSGLSGLKGTGIEAINAKLKAMGMTPDSDGSSAAQKGSFAEQPEMMAEMMAKLVLARQRAKAAAAPLEPATEKPVPVTITKPEVARPEPVPVTLLQSEPTRPPPVPETVAAPSAQNPSPHVGGAESLSLDKFNTRSGPVSGAAESKLQRLQERLEALERAKSPRTLADEAREAVVKGRGAESFDRPEGRAPARESVEPPRAPESRASETAPQVQPPVPEIAASINVGGVTVQFSDQFKEIASAAVALQFQNLVQPQLDGMMAQLRQMAVPVPRVSNVAP